MNGEKSIEDHRGRSFLDVYEAGGRVWAARELRGEAERRLDGAVEASCPSVRALSDDDGGGVPVWVFIVLGIVCFLCLAAVGIYCYMAYRKREEEKMKHQLELKMYRHEKKKAERATEKMRSAKMAHEAEYRNLRYPQGDGSHPPQPPPPQPMSNAQYVAFTPANPTMVQEPFAAAPYGVAAYSGYEGHYDYQSPPPQFLRMITRERTNGEDPWARWKSLIFGGS